MKKQKTDTTRRAMLKGMMAIPVVTLAGFQATTAQAAMVSVTDPTAQALGYTEKSTTDGQHCGNCMLFSAPTGNVGNCAIFAGKQVSATGWCRSWAKKP